jgi:hypothetical protein
MLLHGCTRTCVHAHAPFYMHSQEAKTNYDCMKCSSIRGEKQTGPIALQIDISLPRPYKDRGKDDT